MRQVGRQHYLCKTKAALVSEGRLRLIQLLRLGRGGFVAGGGTVIHFKAPVAEFFLVAFVEAGQHVARGAHVPVHRAFDRAVAAEGEVAILRRLFRVAIRLLGFLVLGIGGRGLRAEVRHVESGERTGRAIGGVFGLDGFGELDDFAGVFGDVDSCHSFVSAFRASTSLV